MSDRTHATFSLLPSVADHALDYDRDLLHDLLVRSRQPPSLDKPSMPRIFTGT